MDPRQRRARTLRLLFGGRPSLWGVLVPVVLLLTGLLCTSSALTARGGSLRPSDTRDLADVVTSRDRTVEDKEARVGDLRTEVKALTDRAAPGNAAVQAVTRRSAPLEAPAGLAPVAGPVLQVTLNDSTRSLDSFGGEFSADDLVIHQQDVQAVVNALWAGGAEAMMIQDQRVTSTSAVRCVGNTLLLHNRVYSPPFVVKAIGDTGAMRASLDADPSVQIIQQYVAAVGLGFDVRTTPRETFPGYDGSVTLRHATVVR